MPRAAALTALLVIILTPQDGDRTRAKEIDEWIQRLGHDEPAEREKAEKQIESLATDVLYAVEVLGKAEKSTDAEVRGRAARTRRLLVDRLLKQGELWKKLPVEPKKEPATEEELVQALKDSKEMQAIVIKNLREEIERLSQENEELRKKLEEKK